MVVHIAEGDSADGIWNWQSHPTSQVSSYFIVAKDGSVIQGVDLNDKAWTQSAGNSEWIGIENAGHHTGPLTDAQVEANAHILAWLHTEYGVPLALTNDPTNGHGLGWHGMGGQAWGGHFGCPGDPIRAQLPTILKRATELVNPTPKPPTPEDDDMPRLVKCQNGDPMVLLTNSIHARWVQDEAELNDLTALYGPAQTWAPRDFYRPVLVGPAPDAPFAGRPAGWPTR